MRDAFVLLLGRQSAMAMPVCVQMHNVILFLSFGCFDLPSYKSKIHCSSYHFFSIHSNVNFEFYSKRDNEFLEFLLE